MPAIPFQQSPGINTGSKSGKKIVRINIWLPLKNDRMKKYRVEFINYEIRSIASTEQEIPSNDTFLEERTGDTIWAILHAENDEEARKKAESLSHSLRSGELPNKS